MTTMPHTLPLAQHYYGARREVLAAAGTQATPWYRLSRDDRAAALAEAAIIQEAVYRASAEHAALLAAIKARAERAVESAELRAAVGPQSDARLVDLFDGACATAVRTALEREQARPGHRKAVYNPMASYLRGNWHTGRGPDTGEPISPHG